MVMKRYCLQLHTCRKCGEVKAVCERDPDADHEDTRYTCEACGYRWWVDGIDS